MIYLDHASTTYVYADIADLIDLNIRYYWGNPSNLYAFGEQSKSAINVARENIAKALGVLPEEIFFTSGSSEGNTWALNQRPRTVCSAYEHHSITKNVNAVMVDEQYLDGVLETKQRIINARYDNFIYSHMLVNNISGEIFDVKTLTEKAHKAEMLVHSDMTQALGNTPINLYDLGVDMATFSGHKVHAPKGIGFNFFKKSTFEKKEIRPLIFGEQERALRGGTENVPYIIALGVAVIKAVEGIEKKQDYCKKLKKVFLDKMKESGVDYNIVSPSNSIDSTVSICLKNVESEILSTMLSDKAIYFGTGSACNTGLMENDSTLEAMGIEPEYIRGLIRLSFDLTNTEEEIIEFVDELVKAYKEIVV